MKRRPAARRRVHLRPDATRPAMQLLALLCLLLAAYGESSRRHCVTGSVAVAAASSGRTAIGQCAGNASRQLSLVVTCAAQDISRHRPSPPLIAHTHDGFRSANFLLFKMRAISTVRPRSSPLYGLADSSLRLVPSFLRAKSRWLGIKESFHYDRFRHKWWNGLPNEPVQYV